MARSSVAAEPERVALLLPGCELPGVNGAELRRALALDLKTEGLVLAPAGELSPERDLQLRVEAACPTPESLSLRAERAAERQSRTLLLSDLALDQRPRALSLALSELVSLVLRPPQRSEALTAEEPPAAEPAPAAPAPTPALVPPPAPIPAPPVVTLQSDTGRAPAAVVWRLGIAPGLRFFQGTRLWGGELQLARAGWRLGGGLWMARNTATSGAVWTRLVQASVGYGFPLLSNAGGSLLESGPRLGVGHTFMSVAPRNGAQGHDARDWYFDGAWTARYSSAISTRVRLGLGVEIGYARGPIGYADDARIAQTSGPFGSLVFDGSLPL